VANIKLALHLDGKLSKILRLLLYATGKAQIFEFALKTWNVHWSTMRLRLNIQLALA